MKTSFPLILILGSLLPQVVWADQWKVQFFHDKDKSSLDIRDFSCPSPKTCLAVGALSEAGKEKPKGTAVSTYDGGAHWEYIDLKEIPYSLFFLKESLGWMVTDKGIWQTPDGGRGWRKLKNIKGVERVWFLDESHGFAVAELKTVYETVDGGKEWTKKSFSGAMSLAPEDTVYDLILFHGNRGIIGGSWNTAQRAQQMAWTEATRRKVGNMAAVLAESVDSGATWKEQRIKVEGKFTRLRFAPDGALLGLVEFADGRPAPSQIYRMDLDSRATKNIFLETPRVARDVAVMPNGEVLVASVRLMGSSNEVPIPGQLVMMGSTSTATWLDEKVDYRAVAIQPIIAVGDSNNVWVATDNGMILKRVPAAK